MKRYHEERHIIERNYRLQKRIKPWEDRPGRYRKLHGIDCGNPQCHLCHSDKFPKRELTRQELMAELAMKEQVE